MHVWFLVCASGMIAVVPLHFLSVEHLKLQEKHGKEKGTRIAEILGLVSGWLFFIFWIGVWISPQPSFTVPLFQGPSILIPVADFSVPLLHLAVSVPFFVLGAWLGIAGVKAVTLKVAETHRAEKVVSGGVYSIVRHPQYVGGLLAHVGVSFLVSSLYSLLYTPLAAVLVYLISRKEEKELVKEFGENYESYSRRVPMLMPRLGRRLQHKQKATA